MRNPNGYGTIRKFKGNRRRPFGAFVTSGYEMEKPKDISFLKEFIDAELFEEVERQYTENCKPFKAICKQVAIGYYSTRQEAMIALAEYNKQPYDLDKSKITFSEVFDALKVTSIQLREKTTSASYFLAYSKCEPLHSMRMRDIRLGHLQNVVNTYSHQSASAQMQIIKLLHFVFNYCMENDLIEKDYSQFVKVTSTVAKKERTAFGKTEIATLWENQSDKTVQIALILIYTGMRIGELFNLKKEDVHLQDGFIEVHGTKTKAANRIVPIHSCLVQLIRANLDHSEVYFLENNGKRLSNSSFSRERFKPMCERLEIKEHTPHECRHTFVTLGTAAEMNQILLKKIVGHSTSDVTEGVYTHTYIEDLKREIEKIKI